MPKVQDVAIADGRKLGPTQLQQMEDIFFQASGRTFASGPEREAFRERWLGRYLNAPGDVVLVAVDEANNVVGYLVGALEDPAEQDRFSDISYFREAFRDLCRLFPAHLHVNVASASRSRGVGAALIASFAAGATAAGIPGVHVVTGKMARNVAFYERCGFEQLCSAPWNGNEVAFLGRKLTAGR